MAVLGRDRQTTGLWTRVLLAVGLGASAQAASLEFAVKANYLYKFAPFVQWPPAAFAGPASPFAICVVGDDPFGVALDQAVKGQTVDGHPVLIRRLVAVASNPECHVVYVARTGAQKPAQVLQLLRGEPVLTVTDEGVDGGIVQFVLRDGKVRFGVDVGAAQMSGLTISSKLLSLAVPVGKTGG